MKQDFLYSLKVWLTTIVPGMRVAGLIKIVMDTDHLIYKALDIFDSAIYDIPVGLIACLPSYFLFSVAVHYVIKSQYSVIIYKLWLTLTALLLSLLPFAILFWHQLTHLNYLRDILPMIVAYTRLTIAGIWLYRLEPVSIKL